MPIRHHLVARLCLATALVESGDRDEAGALLETIAADAPDRGVASIGRWAAELAARAGVAASPRRADAATGIDALTPRERQVLALVAEGRTNREIGETLFMAEKTASVHVSRILAKLDVRSRTEAAAVAHRLGLDGGIAVGRQG